MPYLERKDQILTYLKINKTASIERLAEELFVSPATVRRDLTEMQRLGLVERMHGGAVLVEGSDEISIFIRKAKNARDKEKAVTVLLRHMPDFQTVFIDNSSTCLALVERMDLSHKTVITNGLHIALRVSQQDDVTLIMPGGEIKYNTTAVLGSMTLNSLKDFRFDLSLMSCAAVDENGSYEVSPESMQIKKSALVSSKQRILIFDQTKFGTSSTYRTAELKDYDLIVSNTEDKIISDLRARGINAVNS